MNKKNLLFALALPLLILTACGNDSSSSLVTNDSESSGGAITSDSPVSSESSVSSHPQYEVSGAEWKNVFSSFAKNYNATLFAYDNVSKIDSSTLFLSKMLFDGDVVHAIIVMNSASTSSDPNIKGTETSTEQEYYYSRVGEKVYEYAPYNGNLYRKSELPSLSGTPWFAYDSIASYFLSSFSSFSYDEGSNSYKASSLSVQDNSYKMTDVSVSFSYGKLSSIVGAYAGTYFRFADIDETEVSLPSEEKIYVPGKVSKSFWENVFLEMADTLNCEYRVSYSYDDEYSSYNYQDIYKVAGDAMVCGSIYEDHKDESNSNSSYCYYSKEGDAVYKYSESGNWYTKTSCADYFKEIEDAILLFADYYDSFTFNAPTSYGDYGSYGASSLTIDGKEYKDINISFSSTVPERIFYTLDGYQYEIQGFTGMDEVILPSEESVYREGKVTMDEWETAFDGAKDSFNFRLTEKPEEDSSTSLSESVYLCDYDAIRYSYCSISESGDSTDENTFYSLEDSSYYTYSQKGDFWIKTLDSEDKPTSSNCFSFMSKQIEAFATHFSDFSFDIEKGAYTASSIAIDDSTYSGVVITFEGGSISKIEYTLDSNSYVIDHFNEQVVEHPIDDDLYEKGKVKKETWENAFLEAATDSLNCSYSYSVGNIDYVLNVSGDMIKKEIITNDYNAYKTTTETVYESKEGNAYYLYSESGSEWTKVENEEVKDDFDAISSALMLFSEEYDTFAYDKLIEGYAAHKATIGGTRYEEARVCFDEDGNLSLIRWSQDTANTWMIENFGSISVTLPLIA